MIYLDNAATSFPKPETVYKKVDYILRNIGGNPGRASHRMAIEASRAVFDAREAVAKLFSLSDSSRIVFTKNATEGINIALKGLLKPSDHVVTTSFEHNSVAKTIHTIEKAGIKTTKVRPDKFGFISPASISVAITNQTKIVCLSHASNVFGTLQPIDEIAAVCKSKGVLFMLDAAQTAGALPIDLNASGIDILAATGHKALFGPQGTGFLYIKEGIEPEPLVSGGTGELDLVLETPERLESGTMNTPGIGGLMAGVEFLIGVGVDKVRAHEESLISMILSGLTEIPEVSVIGTLKANQRASLVAFNIKNVKPGDAGKRLDDEFSIMVRTG
ncbi:aminotransferase class V-fold PLP-dependent enzyme, partial [bacterium]